jgi:DnaJ-class molecular chaperone
MQNYPKKPESNRLSSPLQQKKLCHHCEGKGYIELRDCSGEIQREENCSFCHGKGKIESDNFAE